MSSREQFETWITTTGLEADLSRGNHGCYLNPPTHWLYCAWTASREEVKAEHDKAKDSPHTAPRCRQQLAAEGKPYPRSSCEACGQFSPRWRECDARIAAISSPENPS